MIPMTTEERRLDALYRYRILDTPKEGTFDRITKLLAHLLEVPHAGVALVDKERVWFKATHGVDAVEVSRMPGLCATAIECDGILHFEDATRDPTARSHPFVRDDDGIRFYVGAPLRTPDGHLIGTLFAFAPEPRGLSVSERRCIEALAELVMHEIDARRARSELDRTERALQKSQHLESIGMVASGVAHDFNNLLGGILGNVGLLRLELDNAATARELLDEIELVTRRAADLAGQVLAFVGKGDEEASFPIDLNSLIRETSYMLEAALHKETRLQLDLAAGLPSVQGNPTSLRQLIMNLITNASEAYAGAPGTVRLSTRLGADGAVLAEIADDGPGLDAATKERAFEPFFTTKSDGKGLGLAIVQRIVTGLDGSIEVISQPGNGTTMRVVLQASAEQPTATVDPRATSEDWSAEGTMLVVDDEEVILSLARRTLERVGLDVLCANSGSEALELFGRHRESIVGVVLDLSMPGMSGDETFRALRAESPDLPVILSSGHTEREATSRFEPATLQAFLQKPYSPEELRHRVREVIPG